MLFGGHAQAQSDGPLVALGIADRKALLAVRNGGGNAIRDCWMAPIQGNEETCEQMLKNLDELCNQKQPNQPILRGGAHNGQPVSPSFCFHLKDSASSVISFSCPEDTILNGGVDHLIPFESLYPDLKLKVDSNYSQTNLGAGAEDPPKDWGLLRISQAEGNAKIYAPKYNGNGITVYVADTGVRKTHSEFKGRIEGGFNAMDEKDPNGYDDKNGHGTHVAGTAVGATFGVARAAKLVAVKVLGDDGRGSISTLVNGIKWVVNRVQEKKHQNKAVLSLSIQIPSSSTYPPLEAVLKEAVSKDILVTVAAGNLPSGETECNAKNFLPASYGGSFGFGVITVAASDVNDQVPLFSCVGQNVDMEAPGAMIWSASVASDTQFRWDSGTSQATPFVAGALSLKFEELKTAAVARKALFSTAVENKLQMSAPKFDHTVNRLLQVEQKA
jgi:subtilisin family serine protease